MSTTNPHRFPLFLHTIPSVMTLICESNSISYEPLLWEFVPCRAPDTQVQQHESSRSGKQHYHRCKKSPESKKPTERQTTLPPKAKDARGAGNLRRGKRHSTVELKELGEKETIYLRRKGANILVLSMSGGVLLSTPNFELRYFTERGITFTRSTSTCQVSTFIMSPCSHTSSCCRRMYHQPPHGVFSSRFDGFHLVLNSKSFEEIWIQPHRSRSRECYA